MSRLAEICTSALAVQTDLDPRSRMVLAHIAACKTPALGFNVSHCPSTDHDYHDIHYNSCRDRHCPQCQGTQRRLWVERRLEELLPLRYFHVVFTIPAELRAIFGFAPRTCLDILFRAAHASLLKVAAAPDNGEFIPGGISVLHTWNQKLGFHPHVHCIVPQGGLSIKQGTWHAGGGEFLLPIRAVTKLYRAILLAELEKALEQDQLGLLDRHTAKHQLCLAAAKDFVVYCKPPFGGPRQVLKYLGRYTHRVGISEQRIISGGEGTDTVTFTWTDRGHGHAKRLLTVSRQEFINRFRRHILPRGFKKIRYFGFMGNRQRKRKLADIRQLIAASGCTLQFDTGDHTADLTEPKGPACPVCGALLVRESRDCRGDVDGVPFSERLRLLRLAPPGQAGPPVQ
jgi:hypothetical protein